MITASAYSPPARQKTLHDGETAARGSDKDTDSDMTIVEVNKMGHKTRYQGN